MIDLLRAAADLAFTGPWSRVWPFLLLPGIAIWSQRGLLRSIEGDGADPRKQARLAAAAACVPGFITLGLTAGLGFRFFGNRPETLGCVAKLYGPLLLGSVALARSVTTLAVRRARLSRLLRHADPPSPRLFSIATEVGVPVRELPVAPSVCFASGVRHPCVVVSTGCLEDLSDEDLRAALLHERAHVRNRDGLWTTVVSVIGEFGLLASGRAMRLYRASRESLADDEAARYVGSSAVAGVLVRVARKTVPLAAAACLAEPDGLGRRVRRLVAPQRPRGIGGFAVAGLLPGAALAFYPAALRLLERFVFHCGG